MGKLLVVGSLVWPMFLAAGWWSRADHGPAWLSTVVYLAAGRVCHQRPERSFHTAGAQWPVCGRCAGLYLAAPLGAVAALVRRRPSGRGLAWVAVAAAPTAVAFVIEFAGLAPVSSLARAAAALPLGAAVAFVVVRAADFPHRIN